MWGCRRRGSQDVEVSLQIEVDNQPERYSLSASLSAVLGLQQATRPAVLHALWTYIKANRLQVPALPSALSPAPTPLLFCSHAALTAHIALRYPYCRHLLPLASTSCHSLLPLASAISFCHCFLPLTSAIHLFTGFCHLFLPLVTAISFCRCFLPLASAVCFCHFLLPLVAAIGFCCCLLPLVSAMAFCLCLCLNLCRQGKLQQRSLSRRLTKELWFL